MNFRFFTEKEENWEAPHDLHKNIASVLPDGLVLIDALHSNGEKMVRDISVIPDDIWDDFLDKIALMEDGHVKMYGKETSYIEYIKNALKDKEAK